MWPCYHRLGIVVGILFLGGITASAFGQAAPKRPAPRQAAAPPRSGGQPGRQQPARQPPAQQQPAARQGKQAAPKRPAAPFQLSRDDVARLDQALQTWQESSQEIKTFRCQFTLLEYDTVFGKVDADGNIIPAQSQGELKYATPDKGLYHITHRWNQAEKKFKQQPGEHWICDGKAIFEFNQEKQQLIEHVLPKNLQGKAIQDSPLPFVFGSDPGKLKQRYFLRIVTPPGVQGAIWLEAHPRFRGDAENFSLATLILDEETLLPSALELVMPNGKTRKVYRFEESKVNDPFRFFQRDFSKPSLPSGWTKVVDAPPAAPGPSASTGPSAQKPPPQGQPQARRPMREQLK